MRFEPTEPGAEALAFLTERHLGTLSTHRPDGSIHVAPVGFTYEPERRKLRIITWANATKVRNLEAHPGQRVAVCQVDGGRWLTLEGAAEVTSSRDRVAEAVTRYTHRYREPGERDDRVAIEVSVARIMGRC